MLTAQPRPAQQQMFNALHICRQPSEALTQPRWSCRACVRGAPGPGEPHPGAAGRAAADAEPGRGAGRHAAHDGGAAAACAGTLCRLLCVEYAVHAASDGVTFMQVWHHDSARGRSATLEATAGQGRACSGWQDPPATHLVSGQTLGLTACANAQELGTKARPKRLGRVSVGRAIRVRANHFKVCHLPCSHTRRAAWV